MKPMIIIAAMMPMLVAPVTAQQAFPLTAHAEFPECHAQAVPPPPGPPDAPCPPGEPCPRNPEMEKERRMLEAIRVTRMTEALKLSEDQVAKFLPRLKRIEEQQRLLREDRARKLGQLAEMLDKPERQKDLKARLEELDKLDQEQMQRVRQMMRDLDTMLTVEQRARWRVFNERFDSEIREMVREIRKKRMDQHRMRQW